MTALPAAISSDIDTLASIYKGYGCQRSDGYTYAELHMGLENFSRFLEPYGITSTLFMVGGDFLHKKNHGAIRAMSSAGHEIANHTLTHAQDFRLLSPEQKEAEIAGMEELCKQVTGQEPVGFRSPGWNINDDAMPILKRRGYLYDSSVFPSSLNPLLKVLHWHSMRSRSAGDRTTLGRLRYMFAPIHPYHTATNSLGRRGDDDFVEFPVTVMPMLRLPFFATFLLATGLGLFKTSYWILKEMRCPIQYQFHLSDFVDYNHTEFRDQLPMGRGVYIPQALHTPLNKKLDIFRRAIDTIIKDYQFNTLQQWAQKLG